MASLEVLLEKILRGLAEEMPKVIIRKKKTEIPELFAEKSSMKWLVQLWEKFMDEFYKEFLQ